MRRKSKRNLTAIISGMLCLIITLLVFWGDNSGYFNKNTYFDKSLDFVRILDVGQGDCILIYSNGQSALIDTGTVNSAADVCTELSSLGIKELDVMMLSHLHSDHTGGAEQLIEIFGVKNLILPELSTFSEGMAAAQSAINAVTKAGGGAYNAVSGMNFKIGEFEITVLAAYSDDEENNRSIFAMAEMEGVKFLFTGDAEKKVEKLLLKEGLKLKCDVLKLGHHGSNTSSSEDFIEETSPRYAAISVGADNSYGHPHKEIIRRLEKKNAEILRTDESGNITFFVNEGKISLKTEKN